MPLAARLGDNVLASGARARLYDFVARSPGATVQEAARAAGICEATARYHLSVLARQGLLLALEHGHRLQYFRNRGELGEAERLALAALRTPGAARLLRAVAAQASATRRDLCEALGVSRATVDWHLRSLARAGLVAEAREQGRGLLSVPPSARELLARLGEGARL